MATNKQKFWTPGNIIITRGDLQPEYYVIRDDGLAYPCNKTINKWWLNLYESDYDDDLNSIRQENVRKYWDIIEVYTPIDRNPDMRSEEQMVVCFIHLAKSVQTDSTTMAHSWRRKHIMMT